jgi:hypothetical protein
MSRLSKPHPSEAPLLKIDRTTDKIGLARSSPHSSLIPKTATLAASSGHMVDLSQPLPVVARRQRPPRTDRGNPSHYLRGTASRGGEAVRSGDGSNCWTRG